MNVQWSIQEIVWLFIFASNLNGFESSELGNIDYTTTVLETPLLNDERF